MEKIIVSPGNVRGGGNIISPSKSISDYTGVYSDVSVSEETINSMPIPVFELAYDTSKIYGKFVINSNGHLIFYYTGEDSISFSINNQGHLIASGTNESHYSIGNDGHVYYTE